VLPTIVFSFDAKGEEVSGRTTMVPPESPLPT
jgi:hypothetical protein